MGCRELELFIANASEKLTQAWDEENCVVYRQWPKNKLHTYGVKRTGVVYSK
jgi:hypothetical protein